MISCRSDSYKRHQIDKKLELFEINEKLLSKQFYFYKHINECNELDNNYTVDDTCTGCGLCAKRCPVNNIVMVNDRPMWKHHCELCVSCIQSCPKKAIDYNGKTKNREHYLNPNVKIV